MPIPREARYEALQDIRDALQAIVDCYGVGYQDKENLLANLGAFIMEGKGVLDRLKTAEREEGIRLLRASATP